MLVNYFNLNIFCNYSGNEETCFFTYISRERALRAVVHADSVLTARLKEGLPYDEAWNSSALDLIDASRVHCQAFLVSNFLDIGNFFN